MTFLYLALFTSIMFVMLIYLVACVSALVCYFHGWIVCLSIAWMIYFGFYFLAMDWLESSLNICSPRSPRTHSVNQAGLELAALLLPQPPEYWDDRSVPPHYFYNYVLMDNQVLSTNFLQPLFKGYVFLGKSSIFLEIFQNLHFYVSFCLTYVLTELWKRRG